MASIETLEALIKASSDKGWSVGETASDPRYRFAQEAKRLGLRAVANRTSESHVSILKPKSVEDAKPASLSARVGMGEQPLHTDGAHLFQVPDFVVLWAREPNHTATRIWDPRSSIRAEGMNGIFVISSGTRTWLAPAIAAGQLRFDPLCMIPADLAARDLSESLQNPDKQAVQEVDWNKPGQILLLRNRAVLHGRAKVAPGDENRELVRLAYVRETK